MVLKAEDVLREIESAGYQVTGGRESIGDGQDGPLTVAMNLRGPGVLVDLKRDPDYARQLFDFIVAVATGNPAHESAARNINSRLIARLLSQT